MESIIATIGIFFLLANFFTFAGENIANRARAESNGFYNQLVPANNLPVPYRLRGSEDLEIANFSAKAMLVADEDSGRFLATKNHTETHSLASITKLITALVWLEIDGDMEKVVEIKSEDYREGGVAYFISEEKVRAKDLFYVGLIASSNSAMISLVRSSGMESDKFVGLMNKKARELGMEQSIFFEPTGLDSRNVSNARELYILARQAFQESRIKDAISRTTYVFSPLNKSVTRTVKNTNYLLWNNVDGGAYLILGGKTGYIEESGYNFVAEVYSKEKKKNLIVIILGSDDVYKRFSEALDLMDWAYENYYWNK